MIVPLAVLLATVATPDAPPATPPLVQVDAATLERHRARWKPFADTSGFAAVDAATATWIAAGGAAAALYEPGAVVHLDPRAPALRGHDEVAKALADRARRWGAIEAVVSRFRLAADESTVVDLSEVTTASGASAAVVSWWVARPGGWRKLAEAMVEGTAPATPADRAGLEKLRGDWQRWVDAKDPEALAAGAYDPAAAYLRLWDQSRQLFRRTAGVAEEYGTYLYSPTYALRVEPLAVALPGGGAALEVGVFTASNTGFGMRGLYLWATVRRGEAPWRIAFETDTGVRVGPEEL